jgi:hypothetical protein
VESDHERVDASILARDREAHSPSVPAAAGTLVTNSSRGAKRRTCV